VRNLAVFNGAVVVLLVSYAHSIAMPVDHIIPLVLTGLLASVPVALPATFTLAAALSAQALTKRGVSGLGRRARCNPRAGLRPPPKLLVRISRKQLSR
jgi:hypothetical protein